MMEVRRRELRSRMTEAEKRFWSMIRLKQIDGIKFRRQFSVKAYVVDFYAAIPRLAVEIDGGYHLNPEQQAYDAERQAEIEEHGITFLRFTNEQIFTDLDNVLLQLQSILRQLMTQRMAPPLE